MAEIKQMYSAIQKAIVDERLHIERLEPRYAYFMRGLLMGYGFAHPELMTNEEIWDAYQGECKQRLGLTRAR